jgi:hypothetical protein
VLPFDLHVLGLPPAFNLSHDQTLQFKFDARRIKLRNELRVHSLRLGIHFSSEDVKNPCHFECPHRLSDKLLKSSATRLSLTVARWRILRFPLSESTLFFRIFSLQPTGCLCEVIHICRVSGSAL